LVQNILLKKPRTLGKEQKQNRKKERKNKTRESSRKGICVCGE
jgi:hypothetical protein